LRECGRDQHRSSGLISHASAERKETADFAGKSARTIAAVGPIATLRQGCGALARVLTPR
jgi:hypothetical protein